MIRLYIEPCFWPRAILKGPKRSFVVLLLLGVESSSKNVPVNKNFSREQKIFLGTKNVLKGTHKCLIGVKCYLLWYTMILNCSVCLVWPCVASCGLVIDFHGHRRVWPHSTLHVLVWSHSIQHGLVWPGVVL